MLKSADKKQKICFWILALALLGYTIKNIFVGAGTDEGYGIMVGYRLIMGDKLLLEMWEPHQSSAILTALFIQPFMWLSGGSLDFLTIYLRVAYFVVHGLIAYGVYRTFKVCTPEFGSKASALLGAFFYVTSPKCIHAPEYSNQQIWFSVLLVLSLMWYFCEASPRKGRISCLVWAGVFMALDVLAYPSMVLIFPACLLYLWFRCKETRLKACGAFTLPCVAGAAAVLGYILTYMSVEQILEAIPYITGDESHKIGAWDKICIWFVDFKELALILLGCAVIAAALTFVYIKVWKSSKEKLPFDVAFSCAFFVMIVVHQIYSWFWGGEMAAYPQLNYLMIPMLGIYCYYKSGKRDKLALAMIVLCWITYVGVLLMSNWGPNKLSVYAVVGVLGGLLCCNTYFGQRCGERGKGIVRFMLYVLVLSISFGYSYRLIGGDLIDDSIFEVRGINHEGMRKGLLTNYMTAYRYNMNCEIWEEAVPDGSTLLYVGYSQFPYMIGECTIAMPSTISTPTFDETLLKYWEINPDRYPDVVALESWFGDIRVAEEDSFIMQWLKNDFGATEVIEYPYVTVYRR